MVVLWPRCGIPQLKFKGGGDVADFVVSDGWKATRVADHGMVNRECCTTAAGLRCISKFPVIS